MNVNLVYGNSGYNLEITKTTSISYIYKVASKVFKIPLNNFQLMNDNTLIPNNSNLITDYIKNGKSFSLTIKEKSNNNNGEETNKGSEDDKQTTKSFSSSPKFGMSKMLLKKKHFLNCQMCHKKKAIVYCRKCNEFNCIECNIKYPEHEEHSTISLEKGNFLNWIEQYKKKLLSELNTIDKCLKKSNEWIISDEVREEYFDNLIKLIKEIKGKSEELWNIKSEYVVEEDSLSNLKKDLIDIELPTFKEETSNVFHNLNYKDKELDKSIQFINLQIIKTKFNQNLIQIFEKIQNFLMDILNDAKNKIEETENKPNIKNVEFYIQEDNLNENNNINYINHKHNLFLPDINNYLNTEPKEIYSENRKIEYKSNKNKKKNYLSYLIEKETLKTENRIQKNFSGDLLLKNPTINHQLSIKSIITNNTIEKSPSESQAHQNLNKNSGSHFLQNNKKLKEILGLNKEHNNSKKLKINSLKEADNIDIGLINQILISPAKKKKKK